MSFQTDIKDSNSWNTEVLGVTGFIQVIEVYQSWCGPCKAVASILKKLYFDMSDKPLKFYTVDASSCADLQRYRGSCKPVFLIMKDGKTVQTVEGVQAPLLTQAIVSLAAAGAATPAA